MNLFLFPPVFSLVVQRPIDFITTNTHTHTHTHTHTPLCSEINGVTKRGLKTNGPLTQDTALFMYFPMSLALSHSHTPAHTPSHPSWTMKEPLRTVGEVQVANKGRFRHTDRQTDRRAGRHTKI